MACRHSGGVTQPKALQRLADAGNSEVKVPYGQAALADAGLNAPVSFHPKTFYFENSASEEAAVLSTSANLTWSALKSNVEQVLVWRGTRSDDVAHPDTEDPSKAAGCRLTFEDSRGNVYEAAGRQVTFNGPPRLKKGNGMWRVYMPTLAEGFTGYQDGDVLVRFTRTATAERYRIEVASVGSPQALAWSEESTVLEHPGPPPHRMGWA